MVTLGCKSKIPLELPGSTVIAPPNKDIFLISDHVFLSRGDLLGRKSYYSTRKICERRDYNNIVLECYGVEESGTEFNYIKPTFPMIISSDLSGVFMSDNKIVVDKTIMFPTSAGDSISLSGDLVVIELPREEDYMEIEMYNGVHFNPNSEHLTNMAKILIEHLSSSSTFQIRDLNETYDELDDVDMHYIFYGKKECLPRFKKNNFKQL